MTKQKEQKNKKEPEKRKINYFKKFLLAAIILLSWVFVLKQLHPDFLEYFLEDEESNIIISKDRPEPESKLVKDALNSTYDPGAEPPLESFAPNGLIEDINEVIEPEEEPDEENPYERLVETECRLQVKLAKTKLRDRLLNNLNDYRLYLANMQHLIVKFEVDERYELELRKLSRRELPEYIKDIISMLERYDTQLASNALDAELEKKIELGMLSKFVKIEKVCAPLEAQKKLKRSIEGQLRVLVQYIYSSELQDKFINRVR